MTWEIHPIDRFAEHAETWDALQSTSVAIPFLHSAFLLPALGEFGTGREVLAVERHKGEARAATILTRTRRGFWQTFQPSQLPLGPWIARPDSDFVALGRSLTRSLPGFCIGVGITEIDPLLQARPIDGNGAATLDYIKTAWVEIKDPFDVYWEARGKNLKTNMRKQRTKLQTEGTVPALECVTNPELVAQAMEDYGALENAGWKAQDGTAVHPGNAQGRFYRRMLEAFCRLGRGRIYRYRFGDRVVAMDLCIESGGVIVILKTAYDESYKAVSPSTLMRHEEFQQLFASGQLRRIEFYGRVMEWHTRWTENARTLYHANFYRYEAIRRLIEMRNRRRQEAPAEKPEDAKA